MPRPVAAGVLLCRVDRICDQMGEISVAAGPIGDPALGKHPQMIAVGVAAELLRMGATDELKKDRRA